MNDRLLELAVLWGVETQYVSGIGQVTRNEIRADRPRLDIAHDLLAKLPREPVRWGLEPLGPNIWEWSWDCEIGGGCAALGETDFESAVIALAERSGK